MNGWNEYAMSQEQYRDQLRRAEQHRLVKLVADGCQETPSRQPIRNLVSAITRRRPSKDSVPCGDYNRLLDTAA